MKCSNCGHENQEGVKFCVKCGAAYDVSGTGQNKEPEITGSTIFHMIGAEKLTGFRSLPAYSLLYF